MNFFTFLVVGALLVILQTTLLMPTPVWPLAPDFYYIFVAFLASRFAALPALVLIYFLGLLLDVLVGTVLGMSTLLCFSGFAVIRLFSGRTGSRDFFYSIPLIALSFLVLSGLTYGIFNFLYSGQLGVWDWREMGIRTLMVALFTYPLFRLLDVIHAYGESARLPWKRPKVRTDGTRRRRT